MRTSFAWRSDACVEMIRILATTRPHPLGEERTLVGRPLRAWRVLHWTGANYIWLAFHNSFLVRAGGGTLYWLAVALLILVMPLRIAAWYSARVARTRTASA